MSIHIQYKAQIKRLAGLSSEVIPADKIALTVLLQSICEEKSANFTDLLLKTGQRNPNVLVFINQKQIAAHDNPDVLSGDKVLLMSPISGG